jgi:hypothetical protein
LIFIQLSPSSHEGEKVSSTADFHDIHDMTIDFETLVKSNNVLVPSPFQNVVFLSHFLQWVLILHHLLVYTLESHKFACKSLYSQIDFPKGSLANDFTDLVVIDLRLKVLRFIILYYQIEL